MKTPIFFRVDNSELKAIVDSFGENITQENLDAVSIKAMDLDLGYMGYDSAMEGSRMFAQLSGDSRYVQKIFDHSQPRKK